MIATGDVVSVDAAEFVARTRCVVLEKPFAPSALDAMLRAIVAGEAISRGDCGRAVVTQG